jgi:hypothetical protein
VSGQRADREQFRQWLLRQRARGLLEIHEINRQRRLLPTDTHGLARFSVRMALVDLTGSAAKWTRELHDGLRGAGEVQAAAMFASSPPFAATDPTPEDCDRLCAWLEERIGVLSDILDGEAP